MKECEEALSCMKMDKSPGSDGLTVEFYKAFWNKIGNTVLRALNSCYSRGELSTSQRKGIISLIYKKNDPLNLRNWRPITLLNTDYKIAAHALASRIKPLMPKIISTDQNGYIKNRFIGYNIRLIQDVIDFSEKNNTDSCILFLDFSKAFDTIEWEFMFNSLEKFGFGRSFINWVKILYTNITGCVKNNNWLTASYKISRNIRQGCPLSCLLFVIATELLAGKLRKDETLRGVKIHKSTVKVSQLADDTTLFMKYHDVKKALDLVDEFGNVSGLKLNKEKNRRNLCWQKQE